MRTEATSDARPPPPVIEYLVNCDSYSSGDYQRRDFENGVPGVTMLTVVAAERKRREYLNQAKVMLKRYSR
jgi:hypothetical protein